jgi:4-amino-4-deoxy-L-arabinose transferase-like glycosyltransferase
VDDNDLSKSSDPNGSQSKTNDHTNANAAGKEGGEKKPLRIDASLAHAPDESHSVILGGTEESDEGISQVNISFDLRDETRVRVSVESLDPLDSSAAPADTRIVIESQGDSIKPITVYQSRDSSQPPTALPWQALQRWPYTLEVTLFGLALLVYLSTHLVGLTRFPIYFFTDEAIQTLAAENLIRDNFLDEFGTFLPTYFKNGPYYNLSVSVYLQVLPYLLFGKTVFVTRATSVLISMLAAVSVGLILRDIFKVSYWWAGVSLLSIAPAWFLHSRTAFETVLFVSFYAACLYTYLLYRYRSPHYLYYSLLLGALAFYSYNPGQIVIALTAILLLISDARYHWDNRQYMLRGLGLAVILALPYLRFRLTHPEAPFEHLRILDSYWVQPLPFGEKLSRFTSEYLYGLSPGYWFLPNERDLPRHLMKGYGHLFRAMLPFAAIGLVLALLKIRSSAYRTLIISLLVAPAGAALVQIGITRALVFIIPATILIALGISQILVWLEKVRLPHKVMAIGLFAVLTTLNIIVLRDALTNGSTWYQNYGLGGLQYGARELFPKIQEHLEKDPETEILLSPTWANGTNIVARFFLGEPLPIQIGSIDGHLFQQLPLDENMLFVITPDEFQKTQESGKFTDIQVTDTLAYPNGMPGFYFVKLNYVEDIGAILAEEREERRELRSAVIELDGEPVEVKHSLLDIGEANHMFDNDKYTLARTLEANPAIVELSFAEGKPISGVSVIIGSTEVEIKASLYPVESSQPIEYLEEFQGTVSEPEVFFDFGETTIVQSLRIEVRDLRQGEPANVHIWEITLTD